MTKNRQYSKILLKNFDGFLKLLFENRIPFTSLAMKMCVLIHYYLNLDHSEDKEVIGADIPVYAKLLMNNSSVYILRGNYNELWFSSGYICLSVG